MHNNNERGVFISTNDQYTNCNNSNKSDLENNNLEYTIHQMAISQDQKEQLEISGFGNGDFSYNKDSQKIIPELSNYSSNFIKNTNEGQILGKQIFIRVEKIEAKKMNILIRIFALIIFINYFNIEIHFPFKIFDSRIH